MLVELIVPRDLLPDIEREEGALNAEAVDDASLRFGIVELAAILLTVERSEVIIEKAVRIWKLLRKSGKDNACAVIRSPISNASVEINADDSEQEVRERVRDEFQEPEPQ